MCIRDSLEPGHSPAHDEHGFLLLCRLHPPPLRVIRAGIDGAPLRELAVQLRPGFLKGTREAPHTPQAPADLLRPALPDLLGEKGVRRQLPAQHHQVALALGDQLFCLLRRVDAPHHRYRDIHRRPDSRGHVRVAAVGLVEGGLLPGARGVLVQPGGHVDQVGVLGQVPAVPADILQAISAGHVLAARHPAFQDELSPTGFPQQMCIRDST